MKRKILNILLSTVSIFVWIGVSNAQSEGAKLEPEFLNQPYLLEGSDLRQLEVTTGRYKSKLRLTGFEATKLLIKIAGKESPVSTSAGSTLNFVVKIGTQSSDVSQLFQLYKATVKGKNREALYTAVSLGGKEKKNDAIVRYSVKEIGERTYQFSLPANIEKGEYFFFYTIGTRQGSGAVEVFCFSVK